ncbi:PREDICTED: TSC22 domain family protein 4 [Nanorana parkeri]|uniref:TSC22 domain family protein 4 n=1 Tax=Nanorana parkeri TaxID=125878 RepID=UPI000853F7B7|nr:PREDICTED: TSC22 domain family protein 4 [Nanorana parkeri]
MSLGKKRSGFQITSVTSDYLPSSPLSPVSPNHSEPSSSPTPPNGPRSPPASRFRLVRLDQDPLGGGRRYQKGRWTCVDFYHLDVGAQQRAGAGHSLDSGLPRAAPAIPPLLLSPGAGAKGQQAPRSQGAPILTGVTDRETTAQPASRLRLVRLDQDPLGGGRRYQKGRWTCVDFYHLDVGAQQRAGAGHSLDSGLPRAAPAIPPLLLSPGAGAKGQQAPRSQGAPILTGVTDRETTAQLSPLPQPASPIITVQSDNRPSRPKSDVFNERLLLAQTVFRMGDGNDQDSAPNSTGAIDNKIEQAMDLVKTHLLFAVREEVEALKEQIKELADRNALLEHENNLLRTLASPQQLSELVARIKASGKGDVLGTKIYSYRYSSAWRNLILQDDHENGPLRNLSARRPST